MPSPGALHQSNNAEQGKIKLRDNDGGDKNNICPIKDNRSPPAAANLPQQQSSKAKVKCESRDCVAYLSLAGVIFILCSSVLFIGLWYRASGGDINSGFEDDDDAVTVFRRHLTSDYSVEEIRRITRSVILEEMPSLVASFDRDELMRAVYPDMYSNEEDEDDDDITNAQKRGRGKRSSNHVLPGQSQQQPSAADLPSGPAVEFFNPKIRHELEKKDADYLKRTGLKGAAPGGDAWVWLTSYSRIPAEAITGFCRATKEYCPPGPQGHPGIPGSKGNRGDVGMPGPPGMDGKDGKEGGPGPRGPLGQRGLPGTAGLDGRDGVPGEPGLDGIPGRAGADGIPGRNGKDGVHGNHGRNGENGKDGSTGPIGPPGSPGIAGEKGLSGPRGRAGKPGTNGTPGIPGINAWKVKVNGTYSSDLLIPPSIMWSSEDVQKAIVVKEGENLRLRCGATGTPKPDIEWHRLDNRPISYGRWEASSMTGHTLNITNIQRAHMGLYRCFADNGIPPAANATFNIEVQFEPLIRVRQSNLYVANGTRVVLECEVEAFPDPVLYWFRGKDERLLEPSLRYQIGTTNDGGYKSTMQLNMTIMGMQDYESFYCVSKNELGETRGTIKIQELKHLVRPLFEKQEVIVTGKSPPPKLTLDDLCPPPVLCKDCPDPKEKCKDTIVSLHDLIGMELEMSPTANIRYPGLANRTMDCVLYAVGKPVYHKSVDGQSHGSWMKDPAATEANAEKIWVTKEMETNVLYEFANKDDFRRNSGDAKKITLEQRFHGNAHAIFNGSFFYQAENKSRVIRYNLNDKKVVSYLDIPRAVASGSKRLYKAGYNFFDFNVDENGLWVISGLPDSNNTIVTKLGMGIGYRMDIQYSWNISVDHQKVGEMFIVCGVLYAIDSGTDRNTKIRLALDLYQSKLLDSSLTFTNPFRKTTAVAYNAKKQELFTWDNGNQLTYPVRYISIGYDAGASSERGDGDTQALQQETGYDKF